MIDKFDGKYAFLSNYHPCAVFYEGIAYPSVEHAFQAAKTMDMAKRREIAGLPTPGQAKREGRKVTLRPDWEEVKEQVTGEQVGGVVRGVAAKELRKHQTHHQQGEQRAHHLAFAGTNVSEHLSQIVIIVGQSFGKQCLILLQFRGYGLA